MRITKSIHDHRDEARFLKERTQVLKEANASVNGIINFLQFCENGRELIDLTEKLLPGEREKAAFRAATANFGNYKDCDFASTFEVGTTVVAEKRNAQRRCNCL